MIIDHRKTTLDVTKTYNNLRNYFLNDSNFKKSNKEVDHDKIVQYMFPHDIGNLHLVSSDRDRIDNWLKKDNGKINSTDYSILSKYFHNNALIFFKDIDQICEFENSILKACVDKFINFVIKKFGNDEIIDIVKLKKVAMNDSDHFYFQVVESMINFSRIANGQLLKLEMDIDCNKGLNLRMLKCYLATVLKFVDKNILENYKVFGKFTYKDAKESKADFKAIDAAFNGDFSYENTWITQDQAIPFKAAMRDDRSTMYRTGMHLTILGRFRRYINLSLYSSKFNKSIEIIAVNNWINLFRFLKKEVVLYAVNFQERKHYHDDNCNDNGDECDDNECFFEEQCMCILASVRDFELLKANSEKNSKGLNEDFNYIDSAGSFITLILLKQYIEVVNSTTDAFFIN